MPNQPFSFSVVAFGGSRALGALPAGLVAGVLATGARVSVGCCVGADALVVSAVLAAGAASRLTVWAAFGPGGAGSCSLSAVPVVQAAARQGAAVQWWAGGGAAVPLRARLARRSAACVQSAAALVLVEPGAGSLNTAGAAALKARLPLVIFSAQRPAGPGWLQSQLGGLPCWACWPTLPAAGPVVAQARLF